MIKSSREIAGKYLRANRKRTVLTLIGIILSVALISSIGFFIKSIQQTQVQDIKNTYGSWHVIYKNADDELIAKVKNNPNVLRSGTYSTGREASISDRLKVREVFGSGDALELLPYKLTAGRLPRNCNEAALEGWFLEKLKNGGKLGDRVAVLDKEYTVVGILSDTYRNQYSGTGELVTKDSKAHGNQRILVAELEQNRNLRRNIDELKKLSDEKDVEENQLLILAQGRGMPEGMLFGLAVIIGIVVLSTIAVIYNAFQISVVERVKQFGLLRAVGATPKQIRGIILREAGFMASIGIPIGLGCGIAALYGIDLAFRIIGGRNIIFVAPTISIDVVLISTLIGIFSIFVSAMLPAVFAGRISPLVAISSRSSITKEKIKRRKNLLAGRLFGFEGALAAKNIRRNRKRYRITVLSIVISVALFITFNSFMAMSLNVYSESNESSYMHFSVVITGDTRTDTEGIKDYIMEGIEALPQIDSAYKVYNTYYFDAAFDKSRELGDIRNMGNIYKETIYKGESKTLMGGAMVVYDDKAFEAAKDYLKEGSIDTERLDKENGVVIIAKNRVLNERTQRSFYGPATGLKPGDEILLQLKKDGSPTSDKKPGFGQGEVNKVKVLAVLERNPFDFKGDESQIKMITTENVARRLTFGNINPIGLNLKIKDLKLESGAKKDIESIIGKVDNLKLINIIEKNRSTKAVILMVKILLYGFVVVVSLIGSVNIINTLTTNIILRRREFAALKSIGLTEKGLRKVVALEGILYGLMGTLYGSIIGTYLAYLLYTGMIDVREQSYIFPLDSILIAAAGAMLIGYLSVLAPVRRMRKDNLVDAVREDF